MTALDTGDGACNDPGMPDESLEERAGRNESLFREVNEAIERGLWPGEEQNPVRFRCECGRIDCNSVVELTVAQYERTREHPRRFLTVAGHEIDSVDSVVEHHGSYVLVEKQDAAGEKAEQTDPRSLT